MQSYRFTKYLFFISIILITLSYLGNKIAHRYEIYPFFWWQLFTNPAKGTTPYVMHRVYAIEALDTIRLANDGNNLDEVIYNSFINQVVEESKTDSKNAEKLLYKIGELKHKQANSNYLLIEETYKNPIAITAKKHPYAKKIIVSTSF